jgi:hypothetical protein
VFEFAIRSAWAGIVAPELLDQLLVAMDDPLATLDLRFGREPFTALARALEKRGLLDVCSCVPYGLLC